MYHHAFLTLFTSYLHSIVSQRVGTLCNMISVDLTEEQALLLLDTIKRNHRAILDPMDPRRLTLSMIEDTLIQSMKEHYRD